MSHNGHNLSAHGMSSGGGGHNGTPNVLNGTSGNDFLTAPDKSDWTLNGLDGNDNLTGGNGNDALNGGAGNDILNGEGGHDVLTGGSGADTFVFDSSSAGHGGDDVVTDFNLSEGDTIDIQSVISGFNPNNLSNYVELTDDGNGNTIVSVNTSAAGHHAHFEQVAMLQGVTGLDENAMFSSGALLVN
jgi:Ca2+-binding RTX toxin-like protein